MSRRSHILYGKLLWTAVLLLGGGSVALAQSRYMERYIEPRWLTFHLSEISAGVYAEGTWDQSTYKNSNVSVTHEHLFIGPSMTLIGNGSIYHPNLMRYYLNMDGAFGYGRDEFNSTVDQKRNEFEYLGRFGGTLELLPGKPLHGSVYGNYDHTWRDNDFFNRVLVDAWRYGAKAGLELGNWSFNVDYFHRDEESTSPYPVTQMRTVVVNVGGVPTVVTVPVSTTVDQKMIVHEDTATFTARNERERGGTSLTYNYDQYTRAEAGQLGEGTDNSVAIGDGERFGSRDQFRLNSSLSYSSREALQDHYNDLLGNVNLTAEHRPNLSSYFDLNYERADNDDFHADNYSGSATLNHQLYESLASSVTVRASDVESSGEQQTGFTRRYGGGFSEAYTKNISSETTLRLANSLFIDHTDQKFLGIVENERHGLNEAGAVLPDSFYLNAPAVIQSTIVITDSRNVRQYLAGFHYNVFTEGSRTRIQWLSPPGDIKPDVVLVSYRTQPTPAGSYDALTEAFQVRVELWRNLVGVFGRVNLSVNNADPRLRIQEFTSYTVGADVTWHFLRAGAEYEIYDSTDSDYHAARLFQSLVFRPDEASTLSFDLTEALVNYRTLDRQEQDYRVINRYHRSLTHRLGLDFEAGVAWRSGLGIDEVLATVRPSIRYVIGKTSLDVGYDFEYNVFLDQEERQKHMFFLRLRRMF